MGQILQFFETQLANAPQNLVEGETSFKNALLFLDSVTPQLQHLKGSTSQSDDKERFIQPLLNFESESKASDNSWRFVIDMPNEAGVYYQDPTVQICTGPPNYHRYIIKFCYPHLEISRKELSVISNPALNLISSKGSPQTLADVRKFYDKAQIHRIAVLGSARIFPHPDFLDARQPEKGQQQPSSSQLHAQCYLKRIQQELNKFLDVMEKEKTQYIVVNGGWAGIKENSTGIPLISHLIGAISDAHQGYSLPPITIMPAIGSFDRVITRADTYDSTENNPPNIDTYFEIPGEWGDDSPYLAAFSTGLLVFEPFGYWTNIEIANGVMQGKPVAVVRDPKLLKTTHSFEEVTVSLPNRCVGTYRVYRDAGEAAQWIHDVTRSQFEHCQNKTERFKTELRVLRNSDETQIYDSYLEARHRSGLI